MREQFVNSRAGSPIIAWALALVFLALIALSTLFSDNRSARTPGIIDIGTPGAALNLDGAGLKGLAPDVPLIDFADGLGRDGDHPKAAGGREDHEDWAQEREGEPRPDAPPAM